MYRPLTTHVFYFLGWSLFDLNPLWLHVVSFVMYFFTIFIVQRISFEITQDNKRSILVAFLYGVSASHFGHLYYLATEIILAVFFFPAVYFFIRYIKSGKILFYFYTFVFFVFGLMAKENSIVLLGVYPLSFALLKYKKISVVDAKLFVKIYIPFILISMVYLYLHFSKYGVVSGDTYSFNFSPLRAVNTIAWYLFWSFNIPEMFLDFIGPGLKVNQNLTLFWGGYVYPIVTLFISQIVILSVIFYRRIKNITNNVTIYLFSVVWFVFTLAPILFLPEHKFSFYLTLPLFGVALFISEVIYKQNKKMIVLFLLLWVFTSVLTLKLTFVTNWITQGQAISKRVDLFFKENSQKFINKQIYFIDTDKDDSLPWSPTETVKTALSDKNYFDVFHPDISENIHYWGYETLPEEKDIYVINSRIFLGY